ncbi:tRNA (adenine(37)-N6)-methyltransferase-like [Centruroides vittatus]|uniref:tRNA (adenine(37)-N6)-methyltransferase-like n=1 Tax=Centruroides vittatus TaxID=120091 RepID=UPI00350F9A77
MNVELSKQLQICRKELKNIRDAMFKMKKNFEKNIEEVKNLITSSSKPTSVMNDENTQYTLQPIGYIESCFKTKNGTPYQPTVCPQSKARLKILKSTFTNPEHSLMGLEEYSHIWILFIFHKNRKDSVARFSKAKIKPPRLNGKSVGLFSTRSPHRPNALGLTLTRLEKIENDTLHLMGVDLINGTPVVDIKPYIPNYDFPHKFDSKENNLSVCDETVLADCFSDCKISLDEATLQISDENDSKINSVNIASWIASPPINELNVSFSLRAENALKHFHKKIDTHSSDCEFCLEFLQEPEQIKEAIRQLLKVDPRSSYRRKKCSDRLYYFTVDNLHITAWFENEFETEVLRIVPKSSVIVSGNSNTDS